MEKLVEIWKGMSLVGKRASVAGAVFACLFLFYKVGHRGGAQGESGGQGSVHYVRAGGIICNDQYEAAMQARTKGMVAAQVIQGCQEVGTNIEVNVLEQTSFNGFDIVKVGNRGGVGWAAADDVN